MSTNHAACPLCGNPTTDYQGYQSGGSGYDCRRCGRYSISLRAEMPLAERSTIPVHILSGATRNHWDRIESSFNLGVLWLHSYDTLLKALPLPIPGETDVRAKADLFLSAIRRKTRHLGEFVELDFDIDRTIGFCATAKECEFCLNYLVDQELVDSQQGLALGDPPGYQITPAGWAYLSGVGADVLPQGFIAMAFGLATSNDLHVEGLRKGIAAAGFKPLRIDGKEHNNSITDEIVAEIRKSRFVVADLTDKNAGAYFEAGFALGLGKPVIWTCQQTDIDKPGGIHFDTRQYGIVPWTAGDWPDFVQRLSKRIEATLGRGPVNPEACH